MAERQQTQSYSPWRMVLSFVILVIALARLANTCSKMRPQVQNGTPELQQMEQKQQEKMARERYIMKSISNQMMYTDYKAMDSFGVYSQQRYGITKVKKDSIVHFDMGSDLKLESGFYFQKNMDDSLKMAIRTPDMSIFFHDFKNSHDDEHNLKSIKNGLKPEHFKVEDFKGIKVFSYTIVKNYEPYNGFGVVLSDKDNASYAEFESKKLSEPMLRTKALLFMGKHFVIMEKPSN